MRSVTSWRITLPFGGVGATSFLVRGTSSCPPALAQSASVASALDDSLRGSCTATPLSDAGHGGMYPARVASAMPLANVDASPALSSFMTSAPMLPAVWHEAQFVTRIGSTDLEYDGLSPEAATFVRSGIRVGTACVAVSTAVTSRPSFSWSSVDRRPTME